MAALPPTSSINLEGLLEGGEIQPERLITALNQFIGPTHQALNGQLSVANLRAEWIETKAVVPASAPGLLAHYTATAGTSVDTATQTVLNFATKVTDTHSAVTTGAAWKFTAPQPGVYTIAAAAGFPFTISDAYFTLEAFKSGAKVFTFGIVNAGATDQILCGSGSLYLAAGEYLDIRGYHQNGTTLVSYAGTNAWVTVACPGLPTAPACFPLDIALQRLTTPPKAVFLAGAWQTPDPATATIIAPSQPQWAFTTKNGAPHIRIRNISGLTPGKSYKLRFLVVGE